MIKWLKKLFTKKKACDHKGYATFSTDFKRVYCVKCKQPIETPKTNTK